MKKVLLLIATCGAFLSARSQVIFFVENPAPLVGSYDLTYASGTDWGVPDMLDPANAITDTLVFVDDGTAADSLGCNTLVNGSQLAGQIAVVYRGDCEFGLKALNAQNAGAIGVVIINNAPGAPIVPGGGANGLGVTIPVVMISDVAGALLRNQIIAGNVVAFIGSKLGYYDNDLGLGSRDVLMAPATVNPKLVSQNASEFSMDLGSWVYNYGNNDQPNVKINVRVMQGATEVYNQTSATANIVSGDSSFFTVPSFSQANYTSDRYRIIYNVSSDSTDEYAGDNILTRNFIFSDTIFAAGNIDTTTFQPVTDGSYQPAAMVGEFQACIHFRDPVASRLAVDGMWFSATAAAGSDLTGKELEMILYRWDNTFVDLNDATLAYDSLIDLSYGSYQYASNLANVRVFVPLDEPVILEDNARYLFCVRSMDVDIFVGYSTTIDYETNVDNYLQPVALTNSDGNWYAVGFGTDLTPSFGVRVFDKNLLGNEEQPVQNDIVPYPNPSNQIVNIPLKNVNGKIRVEILDMSGHVVNTVQTTMNGSGNVAINVENMSSGVYVFRMTNDKNEVRAFNIVVTK